VASHLSCSPQHSSLADAALPLDELYEEAMRKQIHAHKVSNSEAPGWRDREVATAALLHISQLSSQGRRSCFVFSACSMLNGSIRDCDKR